METRPEPETPETPETIEARLRASAPSIPPDLRQQVLRRCETAVQTPTRPKPVFAWSGRWRAAGAFAGLMLLCWMASGYLDAENQAMIAGLAGPSSYRLSAPQAGNPSPVAASNQNFGVALRWHMRQLALLLHDKHSG